MILEQVKSGRIVTEQEAQRLIDHEREYVLELVRLDPVTVARYTEHRFRHILRFLRALGMLRDFFWRVDFTEKGSPHLHGLGWLDKAPMFVSPTIYVPASASSESSEDIEREQARRDTDHRASLRQCVQFIDEHITCERPENPLGLVDQPNNPVSRLSPAVPIHYQVHRHKANCRHTPRAPGWPENTILCSYGFPWPILDETMILEPFTKEEIALDLVSHPSVSTIVATAAATELDPDEEVNNAPPHSVSSARRRLRAPPRRIAAYLRIRKLLEEIAARNLARDDWRHLKKQRMQMEANGGVLPVSRQQPIAPLTLRAFLQRLDMSMADYILALRASIDRTTVFLKRNSDSIMINAYNKLIFPNWRGNMDLQFVLNSTGLAAYLTSYILKSTAVMQTVINDAIRNFAQGKYY